jgi:hypothetical protein
MVGIDKNHDLIGCYLPLGRRAFFRSASRSFIASVNISWPPGLSLNMPTVRRHLFQKAQTHAEP